MVKTIWMRAAAVIILFCGLLHSCVGGCKVAYEYFAVATNGLDAPVTIEFRAQVDPTDIRYFTETLNAGETRETHVVTITKRDVTKSGAIDALCGSDEQKRLNVVAAFSNNTLGQYTVCASSSAAGLFSGNGITYQVLASSATCTAPYPYQETIGW